MRNLLDPKPAETRPPSFYNFRAAQIETVIRVDVYEGAGTPEDPAVPVSYWTRADGTLLGKLGDHAERQIRPEQPPTMGGDRT